MPPKNTWAKQIATNEGPTAARNMTAMQFHESRLPLFAATLRSNMENARRGERLPAGQRCRGPAAGSCGKANAKAVRATA